MNAVTIAQTNTVDTATATRSAGTRYAIGTGLIGLFFALVAATIYFHGTEPALLAWGASGILSAALIGGIHAATPQNKEA